MMPEACFHVNPFFIPKMISDISRSCLDEVWLPFTLTTLRHQPRLSNVARLNACLPPHPSR